MIGFIEEVKKKLRSMNLATEKCKTFSINIMLILNYVKLIFNLLKGHESGFQLKKEGCTGIECLMPFKVNQMLLLFNI
jgi:hypothetical protein